MPYDPTTVNGKVRLLSTDTSDADPIFSDVEIATFLALEADDVRRAAALALETMASNEALVQKKIRLVDLQTDGPAVAKELRERAQQLRAQADVIDAAEDGGAFDIADFALPPFGDRAVVWNEMLRAQG